MEPMDPRTWALAMIGTPKRFELFPGLRSCLDSRRFAGRMFDLTGRLGYHPPRLFKGSHARIAVVVRSAAANHTPPWTENQEKKYPPERCPSG